MGKKIMIKSREGMYQTAHNVMELKHCLRESYKDKEVSIVFKPDNSSIFRTLYLLVDSSGTAYPKYNDETNNLFIDKEFEFERLFDLN